MRGPLRVTSEMAQPVLWVYLLLVVGWFWLWNLPIITKDRACVARVPVHPNPSPGARQAEASRP